MRRRVPILLAAATVVVGLENWLYLRATAPPPGEYAEEETELPEEAADAGDSAAICADTLRAYLADLPEPELARNSFLTRAEAEELAASGPSDTWSADAIELEGTLVNADRRVAWLDGVAATEGDWVSGHELIRIEPRAVVLQKGSDQLRIGIRERNPEDVEP